MIPVTVKNEFVDSFWDKTQGCASKLKELARSEKICFLNSINYHNDKEFNILVNYDKLDSSEKEKGQLELQFSYNTSSYSGPGSERLIIVFKDNLQALPLTTMTELQSSLKKADDCFQNIAKQLTGIYQEVLDKYQTAHKALAAKASKHPNLELMGKSIQKIDAGSFQNSRNKKPGKNAFNIVCGTRKFLVHDFVLETASKMYVVFSNENETTMDEITLPKENRGYQISDAAINLFLDWIYGIPVHLTDFPMILQLFGIAEFLESTELSQTLLPFFEASNLGDKEQFSLRTNVFEQPEELKARFLDMCKTEETTKNIIPDFQEAIQLIRNRFDVLKVYHCPEFQSQSLVMPIDEARSVPKAGQIPDPSKRQ